MSNPLQFQWHLPTSSPKYVSCSLAAQKKQYPFFANQRLHPSNIKLKIHSKYLLVRAKGDSHDESREAPVPDDESHETPVPDDKSQEAPVPPKRHSFEWKKWAVWILIFLILPSYRHRMGPFVILRDGVDTLLDTAETAAEVVEDLAELVEKLADEAEKKLPDNSKLKDTVEAIERLAERADEKAEQAQDLIHQVEQIGEEIEDMMEARRLVARSSHRRTRLPDEINSKEGAKSFEDLTAQAEEKAEQTQELIQQVENIRRDIQEMDSSSPDATSGSQETGHEDKPVKRLS